MPTSRSTVEQVKDNPKEFANEVFDSYTELVARGEGADLYALASKTADKYKLSADTVVNAIAADPRFSSLEEGQQADLMKRSFFAQAAAWITSFFTSNAEASTEATTAIEPTLRTATSNSPAKESSSEVGVGDSGADASEELESKSVVAQVKDAASGTVETVKNGAEAVADTVISRDRRDALQDGFHASMKYFVQNDLYYATAIPWLKDFGDGVYKNAQEYMPGIGIDDFNHIAFMDLADFTQLMTVDTGPTFTYRGRTLQKETYRPLLDFLSRVEAVLPPGELSIREALMLTCVRDDHERQAARIIYGIRRFALLNPSQRTLMMHTILKHSVDRNLIKAADLSADLRKKVKDLDASLLFSDDETKILSERVEVMHAQAAEELKYQKETKPLESKKGKLQASVQDTQLKMSVYENEVTALKTKKTELTSKLSTATGEEKTKIQAEIDKVDKKIGSKENNMTYKALKDKHTKVSAELGEVNSKLDNLKNLRDAQLDVSKKAVEGIDAKIEPLAKKRGVTPQALAELYKDKEFASSAERLKGLKVEQERVAKKFEAATKKGKFYQVEKRRLSRELLQEADMMKEKYNKAYDAFHQERKAAWAQMKTKNKVINMQLKEYKALIKLKGKDDPDVKALFNKIDAGRAEMATLGQKIADKQKEFKGFAKEFISANDGTIRAIAKEDASMVGKLFKGALLKRGTLLVAGLAIGKQFLDMYSEKQTFWQSVNDIWKIGSAFIPVYGTFQDYQAAKSGLDESGRVLGGGERWFRAAMVPVGVVADATTIFGVGAFIRGGIGATKAAVRGGMAGYRAFKTARGARKIEQIGLGAKAAAKTGKEVVVKGWDNFLAVPKKLKGGILEAPGVVLRNKKAMAIGATTLAATGMTFAAVLEPVVDLAGNELLQVGPEDLAHLESEMADLDIETV